MGSGLSDRDRRILLGILGLAFLLNLVPFWWGLPAAGQTAWAFDEISPWFTGGTSIERHQGRYPPFHYRVLRAVYSPLRALEEAGRLPQEAHLRDRIFRSTGRLLSVLMATGAVLLVHRLALLVFGSAPLAHWAAVFLATSPTLVYYAKTINLEAPYLFWIALSLLFFWKAWTGRRATHYWLYALTATLAVCTKDQAYGLYILPSVLLWIDLARQRADSPVWRRLIATLPDRRIVGSIVVAAVTFTLVHDLIFGWSDFLHHWSVLMGHSSDEYREFRPGVVGQTAMAWLAVRHMAFLVGVPALLLALVGIGVAWRQRHRGLVLLAFPVSYYVFFVMVVLYHYDRFLLPAALVAAPFAGLGAVTVGRRLPGRAPRLALAAALVLYGVARAGTVDLLMLEDARYAAERWLRDHRGAGERAVVLGRYRELAPRTRPLRPWDAVVTRWDRELARLDADYLIWNADEARLLGVEGWAALLEDGSVDYRLASRHHFEPPVDLLRMGRMRPIDRDRPFGRELRTNLKTIDPEVVIVVRSWEIDRSEALDAIAKLWRGEVDSWDALAGAIAGSSRLSPRRDLDASTVAFGLNRDGWTYGDRPGAVVVSNPAETPLAPSLGLRSGAEDGARVVLRWRQGERSLRLVPGEEAAVELPELAPGERLLVLIAAETTWTAAAGSGGELGVAVRRLR